MPLREQEPETLAQLLKEIDTTSQAVLIAQLYGLHAACAPASEPDFGTLVQQTSAGWYGQSRGDPCGVSDVDQSIEVRSDSTSRGFDHNTVYLPTNCVQTGSSL